MASPARTPPAASPTPTSCSTSRATRVPACSSRARTSAADRAASTPPGRSTSSAFVP